MEEIPQLTDEINRGKGVEGIMSWVKLYRKWGYKVTSTKTLPVVDVEEKRVEESSRTTSRTTSREEFRGRSEPKTL